MNLGVLSALRKWYGLVAIGVRNEAAYSLWNAAFMAEAVMRTGILGCIWIAVYGQRPAISGMTLGDTLSYLCLARIVHQLTYSDTRVAELIRSGDISVQLLRPVDLQFNLWLQNLGLLTMVTLRNGVGMFVAALLIFPLHVPHSVILWARFLTSVLLGASVAFLFNFLLDIASFWTGSHWGLRALREALLEAFSGALVPLPILPRAAQALARVLPFRHMVHTPVALYIGTVPPAEAAGLLWGQVTWLLVLFLAVRVVLARAVRHAAVYGG